MTGKINSKQRLVRCPRCLNVLPEPADVPVYKCGGCDATLQAKKRNNGTVDATSSRKLDDDSSGKRKVDQVFGDEEAASSSNQQLLLNSADESDQNSDDNDLHRWNKDQDAANEAQNGSIDAPSGGIQEYLFGKLKMKQVCNDHEASSSSNQQPLVNSMNEHEPDRNNHNDPRSSTELSGHEDPESSPEATDHSRIDKPQLQEQEQHQKQDQDHYQDVGKKQENTTVDATSAVDETSCSLDQQLVVNSVSDIDQNSDRNEPHNSSELSYHEDPESSPKAIDHDHHDDIDQEFLSCRREFEESSSEFEEAGANTRTVRVSDGSLKSSFKSLIAEKLLDTKQKKPMYLDEDDTLSEIGSADLHHHRINDHMKTTRYGGTSYYGSDRSVSSFDGNDNQNPRKHRFEDEHVDSSSGYRFNKRNQHHLNSRFGKDIHRSTDFRSSYGLNEFDLNPKHRSHMISENPKMERIELLKMVRELQNQLERTNISTPPQVPLYNNPARYGRRMAFSGETTAVNRRLDVGSCHHCRPQDRRFSAQLPRQHVCCNGPHYEPNTFYSPRFSALSSPIHNHSEAEFSATDDYIHRNNEVSNPLRSPKNKRYIRPIARGSPWVICYRCYTLLELPQSFLVLNKRCHSLRCGACTRVLNFTLSNGTHVSRYYPEETIAAPPSSEVEDYDELNGSRVGPVSCTDSSFQKNYSTETDRNGSREFSEERRNLTMSRDPSGSTHPSSSKNSGRPRPNGSPLHQLMGYASPSKVIRG